MTETTKSTGGSKRMMWAGWVMTAPPVGLLIMSGVMKLTNADQVVKSFADFGFPKGTATGIGVLELVCVALYLLPQTAVLGAILLTGYLGGATVTHLRVEEPYFAPIVVGVLVWGGLFLRDPRIRALIPFRKK